MLAPAVAERVVFSAWFEAVLNVFPPPFAPSLVERLKTLGLDLTRPLLVAYPAPVAEAVLPELARTLSPGLPLDAALERLGARFPEGWALTDIGRASNEYMRAVGRERAIHRVARIFRAHNNFTEVVAEVVNETSSRLHVTDAQGGPVFLASMIRASANRSGRVIDVRIASIEGRQVTFEITAVAN